MTDEIRRLLVFPALGVAAVGVAVALVVTRSPPLSVNIFFHLFMAQDLSGAAIYASLVVAALWLARRVDARLVTGTVEWLDKRRVWVAMAAVVALSVATVSVYHNHPLAMDEYAQSFQAKIFAQGQIWVDYPAELVTRLIPEKFIGYFFEAETGRVVARYWPGFSLLLAPFMKVGLPWLLNPLLAAGSLLLLAHIARQLLPNTAAPAWAVLFALASPQFTVTAISYYAMTAHLFLNLLFAALLLEPSAKRLVLAGLVGSLALVLHQPLPHVAFALPWIVWLATARDIGAGRAAVPGRFERLLLLSLGYLPLGLTLGAGWSVLQRQILQVATDETVREASSQVAVGLIGKSISLLGFSRLPSLDVFGYRAVEYLKLFLWTVPGLPILAALGWWRSRLVTGLRLLGWSAACSLLAFFFVPFSQGHGWGCRYFHQSWGTVPLLAAACLVGSKPSRNDWIRMMGVLAALSLVVGTALRFSQVHGFIGKHLGQLPPVLNEDARQIRFVATDVGFYRHDLIQNDPWLSEPVLTLVSFGRQQDVALLRQMGLRAQLVYDGGLDTVWLVESDSQSGEPGEASNRGP